MLWSHMTLPLRIWMVPLKFQCDLRYFFSLGFCAFFYLEGNYLMESEQKWRPLYCKEKSRAQTKMAETYCYLEEQFVDDNLQVVNPSRSLAFSYSLIAHFPSLFSVVKCGNLCLIVHID